MAASTTLDVNVKYAASTWKRWKSAVACSDSTRQPVLWVARVRPGRYQLVLRRMGYEGRLVLVDVAQTQTDTVTVGLRAVTRDPERALATLPAIARCS